MIAALHLALRLTREPYLFVTWIKKKPQPFLEDDVQFSLLGTFHSAVEHPFASLYGIFFISLFKGQIVNGFNLRCNTTMCSGEGDTIRHGAGPWSIY